MDEFRLAFLIPYYNHPQKIGELVAFLKPFGFEILVVDDGSDEASKKALVGLGVSVLTRETNGGKGAAVKSGFAWAFELGFSHVLQVDADFQHDLSSLDKFVCLARQNPHSLVCAEPVYDASAPLGRRLGRKFTNFWVAVNTLSFSVKDAMIGLRIYPLRVVNSLKIHSNRMDFDIDILVLLVRAGVPLLWVKSAVSYEKNGVSHFKMFRDNVLISKLHAKHFLTLPLFFCAKMWRAIRLVFCDKTCGELCGKSCCKKGEKNG